MVKLAPGELSTVPYAEPSAFQGVPSPYYDDSHRRFRRDLRAFFDTEVMPDAVANDARGVHPSKELWRKLGMRGVLACRVQSGPWLKDVVENCGVQLPAASRPSSSIPSTSSSRTRSRPPGGSAYRATPTAWAPGSSSAYPRCSSSANPPWRAGSAERFSRGRSRSVWRSADPRLVPTSPPSRASRNCPTVAHYLVSGVKKWITNGVFSDFFVTAVVTKPGGSKPELSLMLIERGEGVDTKPIKTSYSPAAGTAYVTFENAKVPTGNVLGKIGEGFKLIMHNFNHERWYIVAGANRASRLVVEECLKWSVQREVFGARLIDQPVIRAKLARLASQVEGVQAWLEGVTFAMKHTTHEEQAVMLAGPIALLKHFCTRVANDVSDEACQIFGGRAITRTGMGQVVERFQRSAKFAAILGGSEEVMADLGVRQAMGPCPTPSCEQSVTKTSEGNS